MKVTVKNVQKLNEGSQLTFFARNGLPNYPDTYIEVEVSDLLNRGAELCQNFQGVSLKRGVESYYYDFRTNTVFMVNEYLGFRTEKHYKVTDLELVDILKGNRSLDEFPTDKNLDLYWLLTSQDKDTLVGLLYKALKGK